VASDTVAIMAVDGGTTTGVARGVFPAKPEGVWLGLEAGKWDSWEVHGSVAEQAWEIVGEFADWVGAPTFTNLPGAQLVLEDFVMYLGTGASSKRELLDPVRVAAACETLCIRRDGMHWCVPVYQSASDAMNFATNVRLRAHHLWVKGSTHRRDAVRHMATRYSKIVTGK
jgi:hypothetical protein